MLPFEIFYAQETESWLRMNPPRAVPHSRIAGLLGKVCLKAAPVDVAVNGFRGTGLFPYNGNIFHESEFLQEIHNLIGCEETEYPLLAPSGIVQPPASSVMCSNSEETDLSPVPDIRKTTSRNISE
jgi:hypothetical protein